MIEVKQFYRDCVEVIKKQYGDFVNNEPFFRNVVGIEYKDDSKEDSTQVCPTWKLKLNNAIRC